jgi:murein DD-endopeptidase MepM/ murein hydrolase activator NlpD
MITFTGLFLKQILYHPQCGRPGLEVPINILISRILSNSSLIIETARKLDVLSKEAYIQSKSYDEVLKLALNKEKMLASIPAIMPVANEDLKRTASGWGYRIHPIYKVRKMHYGMDFTAPVGTPIYSTGDGKVVETGGSSRSRVGFGLVVKIDHGYGYETVYAHLNSFAVKVGTGS